MTAFLHDFLTAGQNGLTLLGTAVLPVLFPFFVLTTLILDLLPTNRPWQVAILAYLSGYPNGCRLTQTVYEQQQLSLSQAQYLTIMTATPSPIFVIATVGTVFLNNVTIGCVLFVCAVVAAIINGCLWKLTFLPVTPPLNPVTETNFSKPKNFGAAFSHALSSATTAIINVCGVVLFFYIVVTLLKLPPILGGLLEMTTGTAATKNLLLLQFFISFGGLAVAMQHQIFLPALHLSLSTYLGFKLTHGIIACALLSVCLFIF